MMDNLDIGLTFLGVILVCGLVSYITDRDRRRR